MRKGQDSSQSSRYPEPCSPNPARRGVNRQGGLANEEQNGQRGGGVSKRELCQRGERVLIAKQRHLKE